MPKQNLSDFQVTVKNFKLLFTSNALNKATIPDLGLLKEVLVLGTEELNKLVSTLSTISVDTGSKQQRGGYVSKPVLTPIVPVADPQELGMVSATTGLDTTAVSLFDAEAEARRSNDAYMNSLPDGQVFKDEVEALEEMFASIEEGV